MLESFGKKKPYLADFEIADDLVPDPFSEEPVPHSKQHTSRNKKSVKNIRKKEENKENN